MIAVPPVQINQSVYLQQIFDYLFNSSLKFHTTLLIHLFFLQLAYDVSGFCIDTYLSSIFLCDCDYLFWEVFICSYRAYRDLIEVMLAN